MPFARFALTTILLVALPMAVLGCSSEPEQESGAGEASAPAATTTAAVAESSAAAKLSPAETADAFMTAGMSGDEDGVNALMTEKALEAIQSDDSGDLEIHEMPFDEFTIGETEETDDGFAVGVETVEAGETTNVKLLMREENEVLKIFGVAIDMGDGMSFTMNFEEVDNMLDQMVEGLADGLGEAMEQSFSSFGGDSEEQLAIMKAQFDALSSVAMADFEASWKNSKDYAGSTVGEALADLAGQIGLAVHAPDFEEALGKKVSVSVAGLSKMEAIERISAEAGVYPMYPEMDFGFGVLGDAMVGALSGALEGAVEGLDLDAARQAQASAEPPANAIQFSEGERDLPVAFAGPFLIEIGDLVENSPMPTGEIQIVVRSHGLNAGVLKLLSSDSEGVVFEELVDAKGRSLIEENVFYMSGGQVSGSSYLDQFGLELKNLIREVEVIASLKGTQRVTVPLEVQEVTFEGMAPDQTQTVGDLSVKITEVGETTGIEVTGPAASTEHLQLSYWATDEAGETVPINFDFVDNWTEGRLAADLTLTGVPHTIVVKMTTKSETIEYPFAFENIPLQEYAQTPEKIEELSFEGHEFPVSITMKEITDADSSFGEADFTIVNHTNKDILSISVSLNYFDASGGKLDDFPSTISGPFTADGYQILVTAGATEVRSATAFSMPEGTTDIRAELSSIEFSDGTDWQGANGF